MSDLPQIHELSPEMINLIAAGEVIERPASVVKELVENSIDAKSTIIKIELLEAGIKKIIVTDNGVGMTKDQLKIAVKQHTTSKIENVEDLFNIGTLGFRGEALASICQISILEIISSTDGISGYFNQYRAGKLVNEGIIASPKGTKITVNNIFFNTPARYRNLANSHVELSHISSIIEKIAVANPNLIIQLYNNDRLILSTDGSGNMVHLISQLYGINVADNMVELHAKNNYYEIDGYTSTNNVFRSNRNSINIIVNGRIIRNVQIIYSITDAYKSIIPIGKYPITIINIKCNYNLIDVNVHPSKFEIRFTDEMSLKRLITTAISDALHKTSLIYNTVDNDLDLFKTNNGPIKQEELEEKPINNEEIKEVKLNENPVKEEKSLDDLWDLFDTSKEEKPKDYNDEVLKEEIKTPYIEDAKQEEIKIEKLGLANLRYLGQYHRLYLLFEDDDDLYIVDQHAAMERWMYEKIYKYFASSNNENYELIVPIKIDLKASEISLINLHLDEFAKLGLVIEPFGGTTILVRNVPIWTPQDNQENFIHEMIDEILDSRNFSKATYYDHLAKQLACKRSIKAKMHILPEEVKQLMKNLESCDMPYTCPHGRPTIVKISSLEMEKMFKRVI